MKADDQEVSLGSFTDERFSMSFPGGEETFDRVYLTTAYGFRRFGLFAKGGGTKIRSRLFSPTGIFETDDRNSFQTDTTIFGTGDVTGAGEYGFLYGGGAEAHFNQENFRIGLKGEYLLEDGEAGYTLLQRGSATIDPIGQTTSSVFKARVDRTKSREFHAAMLMSLTLRSLTSYYGGIKYSDVRTRYFGTATLTRQDDAAFPPVVTQNRGFRFTLSSEDSFGIFVGVVYRLIGALELNAEVRTGDETGVTARLGLQF